jgi:dipeptidyl-peptidase-4
MRNSFVQLIILSVFIFTNFLTAQEKTELTLEDIFSSNKYVAEKITNIQWQPDGSAFTYTDSNKTYNMLDIYKHDVETGENTLMVESNELYYNDLQIKMSNYSWTADGEYLLIEGPEKEIWRHSRQAPFYLYSVKTEKIIALGNNDPGLRNVKLSPDGSKVGFVRNHNIYVTELATGIEKAITEEGTENILNGEFDWVYEEEFGLADGWRWSPDGKKIAFWRFDQTRVKEFYMIDEMFVYNKISPLKYPKTGEENSIIKIGAFNLASGETNWMDIGEETDIYIPRIYWTNSSDKLAILRLNRLQNYLELLISDTKTGEVKTIVTETDPCWIDVDKIKAMFLRKEDSIIWVTERSGYRHAYLYDYKGKLINPVTSGDWEITSVEGVSENDGLLYFYGKKDSPLEQHIYRVKLNGENLQKVSDLPGWHTAEFSPGCKYFINEFSSVKHPTKSYLQNADGTLIRKLKENNLPALNYVNMVYPEFSTFTTSDDFLLNYYMIKPHDFDPGNKYPVLVYGYGGPGSQKVINKWDETRQLWHQMMTEKGYIVFCVDNRGTGGQGKALKNLMYKELSKWSVNDHIEAAKYLTTLSYVDTDRIGFWGWSGGGYLCLMLMTRANEYFSTGVSVAPVSDFHLYDAIWTERFMGMLDDNADGYKASSVFTYAENLKGNLLIVHGTGDDNVHYQNTMQIVREFQLKGKQFDLMLYPNKNHSIKGGNTRLHLFTKIADYFLKNL